MVEVGNEIGCFRHSNHTLKWIARVLCKYLAW